MHGVACATNVSETDIPNSRFFMRACVSEKFVIEQYSRDPRVRVDPFVEARHGFESKGLYAGKANIEWRVISILDCV